MSREIDERIVQMQFNNRQFEEGARETMSTLESLKKSLDFNNCQDGLAGISASIKGLPINALEAAADTIYSKFSLLGTMFDQFVRTKTNELIGMVNNLVDTMNVSKGALKAGFSEYETQINSTQTIWANTKDAGTTMQEIIDALDELNEYADKTIYNFTEMTNNIGRFTAAGVGLKESTRAIQGIANAAALSGASSQQASNAMYQLSQALAAGSIKMMDWKSVENASMGGKLLQDQIIATAKEMGVRDKKFRELTDGSIKFRDSLSSGWLTTEVFLKTMEKFTDETTEFGQRATDAATKVKTFSQMIDTLKEAVGSGWTETWRYILGDFEQARETFTAVSKAIEGLLTPKMNERNDALRFWARGAEKTTKEIEDLREVVRDVIIGKYGNGQNRRDALTAAGFDYDKVQNIVNKVFDLGQNLEEVGIIEKDIEKTEEKLTGRDSFFKGLALIGQTVVNVLTRIRLAYRRVFKAITGEDLTKWSESFADFVEKHLIPTERTLVKFEGTLIGLFSVLRMVRDVIFAVGRGIKNAFSKIIEETNPNMGKLLDATEEWGYTLERFVNSDRWANALTDISSTVELAFEGIAFVIDWVIDKFKELSNLNIKFNWEHPLQSVLDTFGQIKNVIFGESDEIEKAASDDSKGINKYLEKIRDKTSFAEGEVDQAWNGISGTLDGWKDSLQKILDKFTAIKDFCGEVCNSIETYIIGLKEFAKTVPALNLSKYTTEDVKNIFTAFSAFEAGKMAKNIAEFVDNISEISEAFSKGKLFDAKMFTFGNFLVKLAASLLLVAGALLLINTIPSERIGDTLDNFFILLSGLAVFIGAYMAGSKFLGESGGKILTRLGLTMLEFAAAFWIIGKTLESSEDPDALGKNIRKIVRCFGGIIALILFIIRGASIQDITSVAVVLKAIGKLLLRMVAMVVILGLIPTDVTSTGLVVASILAGIIMVMLGIIKIIASVGKSDFDGVSKVIISMIAIAVAMLIMAGAMVALSFIPEDNLGQAIGLILLIAGVIGALTLIVGLLGDDNLKGFLSLAAFFVAFGIAMVAIAGAMYLIKDIDNKKLIIMTVIVGILVGLVIVLAVLGKGLTAALPALLAVAAVIGAIGLVIASIGAAFAGISSFLDSLVAFSQADLSGFGDRLIELASRFFEFIAYLEKWLPDQLPSIIKVITLFLMAIVQSACDTVISFASTIAKTIITLIEFVLDILAEVAHPIGKAVSVILISLLQGIIDGATEKMDEICQTFVDFITSIINNLAKSVVQIALALANALIFLLHALAYMIRVKGGEVKEAFIDIGEAILEFFDFDKWKDAGKEIVQSMIDGIKSKIEDLKNVGFELGEKLYDALHSKKGFDEHSDSKKSIEVGEYAGHGVATGMRNEIPSVEEAGYELSDAATNPLGDIRDRFSNFDVDFSNFNMSSLDNMKDLFGNVAEEVPVDVKVKPVLDLSHVSGPGSFINDMMTAKMAQNVSVDGMNVSLTKGFNFESLNKIESKYDDTKLLEKMDNMSQAMSSFGAKLESVQVILDSGVLVGQISPLVDQALARRANQASRRVRR